MGCHPRQIGPTAWEPEPLQLPLEPPTERNRSSEEGGNEPELDEAELPGSYVTVIDLG